MLYFRMLLTMLVSLYTSRIVLEALGVEDFGIYNVVGGVVSMLSFINGAMGGACSRFLSFEIGTGGTDKLKKTFSSLLTVNLLIALAIFILLETVGLWMLNNKLIIPESRMVAANWVFQLSVLASVIAIAQIPFTASVIAHEKMNIYAYLGIYDVIVKLAIAYLITVIQYDKLIMLGSFGVVNSIVVFIAYNIFCKRNFSEINYKPYYEKAFVKQVIDYTGWSFIGSFTFVMKTQGINILLNIFFGPTVNAARGIAYQVNTAVNGFTQNFTLAINPQVIKSYASKNYTEMFILVVRGSKLSFYLLFILGLPILLETEYILGIWLKEVPRHTVIFTQLVLINSIIESFTYVLGTTIQATGEIKWYQVLVGGFLLLNLPLSYLTLKLGCPPETVFVISIVLAFIALGIRVVLIKKQVPNFSARLYCKDVFAKSLVISILAPIIPILLKEYMTLQPIIELTVISTVSLFTSAICILYIGLSNSERRIVLNFAQKTLKNG